MATGSLRVTISFEALLDAISSLSMEDKQRLLELLEEQLAQDEEAAWERDPVAQAEMQAARDAYASGDYITLDEYDAHQPTTPDTSS